MAYDIVKLEKNFNKSLGLSLLSLSLKEFKKEHLLNNSVILMSFGLLTNQTIRF